MGRHAQAAGGHPRRLLPAERASGGARHQSQPRLCARQRVGRPRLIVDRAEEPGRLGDSPGQPPGDPPLCTHRGDPRGFERGPARPSFIPRLGGDSLGDARAKLRGRVGKRNRGGLGKGDGRLHPTRQQQSAPEYSARASPFEGAREPAPNRQSAESGAKRAGFSPTPGRYPPRATGASPPPARSRDRRSRRSGRCTGALWRRERR